MNETEGINLTLSDSDGDTITTETFHLNILMSVVPKVVPIIFVLVIIIGFIGNLLVVLTVTLNKSMRNTTNILIFNLAVSCRLSYKIS